MSSAAKVSAIIPCGPSSYAPLVRLLSRLNQSICDEVVVARFDASHFACEHALPVVEVPVPWEPDIHRAMAKAAFEAASGDWVLLLYPNEWLALNEASRNRAHRLVFPGGGPGHNWSVRQTLAKVDSAVHSISLPVCFVEEEDWRAAWHGHVLQARLYRKSAGFQFQGTAFPTSELVIASHLPIMSQPYPAFFYRAGDMHAAMRLSENSPDQLERKYRVLARSALSKRRALEALWALFEHYSSHEELWRLGVVLEHLPYTLEEDESVAKLRAAYEKQVGHLGPGCLKAEGWYRSHFTPEHAIDAAYVELGDRALTRRCRWLIGQCRARGLKRILELGCIDGANLFPMTRHAQDLEIHGVDVAEPAVAHARALAQRVKIPVNAHHAKSFKAFSQAVVRGDLKPFDAAAVFEVLEHNPPELCSDILDAAEACLRPGGRVFISTPCGAWSLHDPVTWDLGCRKDHVNCWTVNRMLAFLKAREAKDLVVDRVENTDDIQEANAWCFASYST